MTVSADDHAAFTELFEQHRGGVHAFLLARTSDREVARDLLQDTFLRLWRRLDEIGGLERERQRAWIYAVARNLVIDRYRADGTRRATLAAIADEAPRTGTAQVDAADQLAARDELAFLQGAIAALPEDERVILTMSVVAEMTSQQVGEALDLPAGTVRYKLHRARARLAEQLEDA
jgi:RNA polymerase sigma-70 factor, ECF subfamily